MEGVIAMYQNILFDLDGTVTDPCVGITNSVAYALDQFGIGVPDKTRLYPFIGPPLSDSFARYYGFSEEQCELAVKYYREYYAETGIYENKLYDGMEDLLKKIKTAGKRIVLATSKPEEFAERVLKYFHVDHYFDFIAGATMDGIRSRKADVISYALKSCAEKDLSEAVMIGDREYDIFGAREAGIASIGVLYGYGSEEELRNAGADAIAETVHDIITYL